MRKVLIPLMVLLVAAGAFARGSEEAPPEISVGDEETVYLSPQSSPNVQDSVTIPITVTADESRNDVVVAYEIVIQNSAGQPVWTESGADETEQPGFFGRLMLNMGLRDKETTVAIPASREWDGTYLGSSSGADGATVPDGDYTYTVSVTDSGEMTGTSEPRTVVIDNTLPDATAAAEYDVFSPDGDSRKDTISLTQSASTEDQWVGSMLKDGSEVFRVEWAGSIPTEYTWDGKDLAGRDLADGDYVYQLSSTDKAGNSYAFSLPPVTIDTAERPLTLRVDNAAFSPNGDGVKDTVTLDFGPVVLTRLSSAVITVSDSAGTELQSVEVGSLIANPIVFNGFVNAAGTLPMPEGAYQVSVRADYENGAISEAGPTNVVVDTTPPSGSVSASAAVFSPEGDGLKDTVAVTHAVAGEDSWRGFVFIPGDQVLYTFDFGTAVPPSIIWNGTDMNGNPAPDATYSYQLIGTDAAGNQFETDPVAVTIDRRPTTMNIGFSRRYFSPNGDDQGDTVTVRPNLSIPTGITGYTVTVKDSAGEVVGSGSGVGDLPAELVWDGRDLSGSVLPEGDYVAELALVYEKGNRPVGMSPVLTIDNTIPSVSLRASSNRITPDGDGADDTIRLTPSVSPAAETVRFSGRLLSLGGQVIGQAEGVAPTAVTWDGTTAQGAAAPVGGYIAILEVEHRNGTIREARTGTIALGDADGVAPQVALRLSPQIFSPDGDGIDDTVTMTLAILDDNPIGGWGIRVYEPDGDLFHSFVVGDGLVRSVEWDGRNDAGELVEMAVDYDVRFEVIDAGGNIAEGGETLTVDVLTEPLYGGRRILVDNILFEGYTTRFLYWDNDAEAQNVVSLEKMGDILRKFPEYSLEIHGHAVSVLYYDAELSDREHREVLIPLSEARAEVIQDVFVGYGADESRFTLYGFGKSRPLVPFSDLDERPINRRVEFYLVR
ncbi:MAG: hypothetical protein KOO61_03385 [Spirochaetales bacterium]|nr:hypothetical protein [Spirochaetales bacterium]